MKKTKIAILLVLALSGCSIKTIKETEQPKIIDQPLESHRHYKKNVEWRLAWSDEFNYTGKPNPELWSYEVGPNVRNNEKQEYTSRAENVIVDGENLVITAVKESFGDSEYTSGSIITHRRRINFLYGRIEIRAKLPEGKGVWPAFWLTGENDSGYKWPASGEIDVFEYLGIRPGIIHGTIHYESGEHVSSGNSVKIGNPGGYNVYGIEWNDKEITWHVNGNVYHSFSVSEADRPDGSNPFHTPHIIRINLALGGDWGGDIDPSIFPQKYVVDWVRVYNKVCRVEKTALIGVYRLLLLKEPIGDGVRATGM